MVYKLITICCCALAVTAVAQRTKPLTPQEYTRARELALQGTSSWIEKNNKELAEIERRAEAGKSFPADDELKAKLTMTNDYLINYHRKHTLYQEMRDLEQSLKDKRRSGKTLKPEELDKVREHNAAYAETLDLQRTLKEQYKERFGRPIKDPLEIVLDKIFKPDALAKGENSR